MKRPTGAPAATATPPTLATIGARLARIEELTRELCARVAAARETEPAPTPRPRAELVPFPDAARRAARG